MMHLSASFCTRLRRFRTETDGVGTVTSMFLMIVMLLVMGLGLDYSHAVRTQARLQAVADAAALSAAMRLPDRETALTEAMFVSALNGNNGNEGALVRAEDIEFGTWLPERGEFLQGGDRPNAVRVLSRRSEFSENALPTLLLRLVGIGRFNLAAQAIALRNTKVRCSGGGFYSVSRTSINNSNHFFNGFCLHGEQGVTLKNNSYFELGTTISMPNLDDFSDDRNSVGVEEALREYSHTFVYLDQVDDAIAALRSGDAILAGLPSDINGLIETPRIRSDMTPQRYTLYVVDGDVDLGNSKTISDIVIVARGNIRIGSNVRLDRVILASEGSITMNSNNRIGRHETDFCATGLYSVHLLARENISFNTNNELRDVLMVARGAIDMGNNNVATDGILAEAIGPITVGNSMRSAVCRNGLEVELSILEPAGAGGSNLVR